MSLFRPWKWNIRLRIREPKLAAAQNDGYLCKLETRCDWGKHFCGNVDISRACNQADREIGGKFRHWRHIFLPNRTYDFVTKTWAHSLNTRLQMAGDYANNANSICLCSWLPKTDRVSNIEFRWVERMRVEQLVIVVFGSGLRGSGVWVGHWSVFC